MNESELIRASCDIILMKSKLITSLTVGAAVSLPLMAASPAVAAPAPSPVPQPTIRPAAVTALPSGHVAVPDSLVEPAVLRTGKPVTKKYRKVSEKVAFATVKAAPRNCNAAQESTVVRAGKPGVRTAVWRDTYVDGKVFNRRVAGVAVTTKPVARIVAPCLNPTAMEGAKALQAAFDNDEIQAEQKDVEKTDSDVDNSSVGKSKQELMRAAGIPESDWKYVDYIVTHESSWKATAVNKSSGACSLIQALPCSKLGPNWRDPVVALKWQKKYVQQRYGGYEGAYNFWKRNRWY